MLVWPLASLTPLSAAVVAVPPPPRVGVDYGLCLVVSPHLSRRVVLARLEVTPDWPVTLKRWDATRWVLSPLALWPPHRVIQVRYRGKHPWAVHFATDADRWVLVDLTHQTATAYQGSRPVRTMAVSTGVAPQWVTPTGDFWIFRKVADDHMRGGTPGAPGSWDVAHVPWAQYFYGGVALHGAWWNRQFGVPKSHGCVQLATRTFNPDPQGVPEDAGWLWQFTDLGTLVEVRGKTPVASPQGAVPPAQSLPPRPSVATYAASSIR